MENLAQLEALCEILYNSQDSSERAYAENTLRCFTQDTNSMPQLEYILENARNPYAVLFASSSLLKHVTENRLPLQLRLQIRNHVVNYLASRSANLEHFVMTSLIQLLCQVTKFSWFDDDKFPELVNDVVNFLNQQGVAHCAIGLKILNQLVIEMNQSTPGLTLTQNRKVATKFKDHALLQIYGISVTSLLRLKTDAQQKLQELALSLSLQCLSYDFNGTSIDESCDETGANQIPLSWRSIIEEPSTVQIYFDYYAITSPPLSKVALECLVRLICTRRGLFTSNTTRMQFLTLCMMGTKDILETGRGLNHHDNYHELCRLLGRFKLNYPLSDLVSVECFNTWMNLVSDLTLKSLQSWKWTSSSIYYLLGLVSKMITTLPYSKESAEKLHLNEFVPKILEGFISSRFDSIQAGSSDDLSEDPLDNVELIQDQLDFFPYLFRFQYGSCSTYLANIMDLLLQEYMEGTKVQDYVSSSNIAIVETKLAWMVYIVGAIMRVKNYSGGEPNEVIDAELSARVLQLINFMDAGSYVQRYSELSRQRLELAVLSFFQSFRITYVGDQAMQASKLYLRLSELLGLHDHLLVLDVIVQKIAKNLKFCSESDDILDQTLALFLEMASGYSTGKTLLKLDTIKYLKANHSKENFLFLKDHNSRRRTTFYYTIGILVFSEDSIVKFKQTMEPFQQVFVNLESIPEPVFRDESVKCAFIGLMRDLRGITMASHSKKSFGFLFDWLYPSHMPVLLKAMATWVDSPEVTTSLLKFIAELVLNKAQRLMFDQSSPNGILLFREVSKLLVAYGSRILSLPVQKDIYRMKYKGIWVSLVILTRAMSGNYVNFGVFELYGDRALDDALDIALKMVLSIPAADILAYRKVSKAYFSFIECIMCKLTKVALNLDGTTFKYIVRSLHSSLQLFDSAILSQCANAIDHLATFYFEHILMAESPASPALLSCAQHISDCGDIFLDILKTLFELILFESSATHWDFSRPILSLILLSEEMYTKLKAQIVASQPMHQQRVLHSFDILMEDVTRSLESVNRERFSRNLQRFKKEFLAK
ncbi:uncharacterized protein LOC130801107 isoform X2 [Amaranthus tricolor]|uniref:uncharacterized protein LOC130801107 isoform X2 n=1 Tax=Amaranthus tricolor TaxID=29722 RepID=UPI00258FA7D3|nr:uncharacterized protein LOC130801107 isoform X2 [Amaranthus tricolor]